MSEFIGAHSKDSHRWPKDAFAELAVAYCKEGVPIGGVDESDMRGGTGTVTGVAVDCFGSPSHYEIAMRGKTASQLTYLYLEANCVSMLPFDHDDFQLDDDDPPLSKGGNRGKGAGAKSKKAAAAHMATPAQQPAAAARAAITAAPASAKRQMPEQTATAALSEMTSREAVFERSQIAKGVEYVPSPMSRMQVSSDSAAPPSAAAQKTTPAQQPAAAARAAMTVAPASAKRLMPEQTATAAPHSAAAAASGCDCYTKCKGICVNAPVTGSRKRVKKEEPPLFLPQCAWV
jgi:pyruvate/2-oxoglutarate dehydrogenase complex dihydrolipoamide acyltransferase (E2) component